MTNYSDPQTAAIMSVGMKALRKALGSLEVELFLVNIKQEQFDYTEWRQDNLWVGATADEILEQAAANDPIGTSFGLD
jgi:hypothetical protein